MRKNRGYLELDHFERIMHALCGTATKHGFDFQKNLATGILGSAVHTGRERIGYDFLFVVQNLVVFLIVKILKYKI